MPTIEDGTDAYHEMLDGVYLKCRYHEHHFDDVKSAQDYFANKSPYSAGKPTSNAERFASEKNHVSKEYCGNKKYIIDSIVYGKCPNRPRHYKSPFGYKKISNGISCLNKGKQINSNNNHHISPVPPAIYPGDISHDGRDGHRSRSRSRSRSRDGHGDRDRHGHRSRSRSRDGHGDRHGRGHRNRERFGTPTTPLKVVSVQDKPDTLPNEPSPNDPSPNEPSQPSQPNQPKPNPSTDIPEMSTPISTDVIQIDQTLSGLELETKLSDLLSQINTIIDSKVAEQLVGYDLPHHHQPTTPMSPPMSCVNELKLKVRMWFEQKRSTIRIHTYTKTAFIELSDNLITEFENQFIVSILDCVKTHIASLKSAITPVERKVQAPQSFNTRQKHIMDMLNINMCSEYRTMYTKAIDQLSEKARNKVPMVEIEKELTPVDTNRIHDVLESSRKQLKEDYKQTQGLIVTVLNGIYAKIEPLLLQTPNLYDMQTVLNYAKRIDTEYWKKSVQKEVEMTLERRLESLNVKLFDTCFAQHKILMDMFVSDVFPTMVKKWMEDDVRQWTQNWAKTITTNFQYIHDTYATTLSPLINNYIDALNIQQQQQHQLNANIKLIFERVILMWVSELIQKLQNNEQSPTIDVDALFNRVMLNK